MRFLFYVQRVDIFDSFSINIVWIFFQKLTSILGDYCLSPFALYAVFYPVAYILRIFIELAGFFLQYFNDAPFNLPVIEPFYRPDYIIWLCVP